MGESSPRDRVLLPVGPDDGTEIEIAVLPEVYSAVTQRPNSILAFKPRPPESFFAAR